MKIYVCCDIEGIASLSSFEEAKPSGASYPQMALQFSKEVAAACRGILDGGATEVIVEDFHGNGRNIIPEYLPQEVTLLRGVTHDIFGITGIFDNTFDGIMFVGYHDCAGNNGSPVAHTMVSSLIYKITLNDKLFSEFHHQAYAAANLGVPSIFISGDSGICEIARQEVENINVVETKRGMGSSVLSISPLLSQKLIELEAKESIKTIHNKAIIKLPDLFRTEVTYIKHYDAYAKSHYPGTRLISPNTIAFKTDNFAELMRFFYFVI